MTTVLLPGISQKAFGSATLMTTVATAYMFGALIGAVIMARLHQQRRGWVALAWLSLYGVIPFSLLFAESRIVPVVAYLVAGLGIEVFNISWFTSVQNEIPPERLSRVSSLDFLFSYGLAPAGLTLITPLADALGRDALLFVTGTVCVLIPLVSALVPTTQNFSRRHISFRLSCRSIKVVRAIISSLASMDALFPLRPPFVPNRWAPSTNRILTLVEAASEKPDHRKLDSEVSEVRAGRCPSRRLSRARVSAFLEILKRAFPKGTLDELAAHIGGEGRTLYAAAAAARE